MLLRTIAIAVAGSICVTTTVFAADLEVTNTTNRNIHHLYLSPANQNTWGPDQLGDEPKDVIEPGSAFTLTGVEDGTYDVKFTLDDGSTCIVSRVEFEGHMEWKIDDEVVNGC